MLQFVALSAVASDAAAPAENGGGKADKPAKPAREKANGVTRPSAGTSTGKVWEIADSISQKENRPATRAEVVAAGSKAGLNPATVTTQFGQWRRFYGIKKELVEKAKTPKAAKPKKGKKAAESTAEDLEASNERSAKAIADAEVEG